MHEFISVQKQLVDTEPESLASVFGPCAVLKVRETHLIGGAPNRNGFHRIAWETSQASQHDFLLF